MTLPSHQKYKDSGTQWLGKVPSHWETQRVKRLFEIKKRIVGECGFDVLSITQQGIKIKDIESNDGQLSMDYSKYQLVEVGDFAMNHMDLLTGYVDISISEGVTSPDYRVFTIKNETTTDSKYFLYLFQNGYKRKIFYAFGQGASQFGRWRLPTEQFNDFLMPFPPVSEQKSIVKYLDKETAKIDALIAEQNKLVELLKEKRQGIISHAVTKGLNPKAKMKDSGVEWLGEVPEGWEVVPLKSVATHNDATLDETTHPDTEILYVDISGVDAISGIKSKEPMLFSAAPSRARRRVKHGDMIISTVRTYLRAIARVRNPEENLIVSTGFAVIRPQTNLSTDYVGYVLSASYFIEEVIARSTGVSYPAINASELVRIPVTLPSFAEQITIAVYLDKETEKIDNLIEEASKASELLKERRSALISAAVTGKIDVRNSK